jgi:hypothetical protein
MANDLFPGCVCGVVRLRAGLLLAGACVMLTGCSAMKVKLGMKVDLPKTPVASMKASLPDGPAIAPGEKAPLVVTLTQPDGKVLQTEGKGGGGVMWKDLSVTATVATVNAKGIVTLPHDPRVSEGQTPHLVITVPSHPDLRTELDIPVRYNYKFTCNFSGTPGTSGSDGIDGTPGMSGAPGSIDPNSPSPGGNGGSGTAGTPGGDGGPGGNAPNVLVQVRLEPGNQPLLQVEVSAPGHQRFYLVDPQGGSLTIAADGGRGGSGGRGGRGGQGGSGGVGTPNGSNGNNGTDGANGFDGAPGRGGSIRVAYDPSAKPYLNLIHLSNKNGPPPTFDEQPVPELW